MCHHKLRGSSSTVYNGEICSNRQFVNFDLKIKTPEFFSTDYHKICHSWLCRRDDSTSQLWCKSVNGGGGFWAVTPELRKYIAVLFRNLEIITFSFRTIIVQNAKVLKW